jgi:hypothetical protein
MSTQDQQLETPESASVDDRSTPPKVEHPPVEERVARGKAARAEVPRRSHGEWEPPKNRADPVATL